MQRCRSVLRKLPKESNDLACVRFWLRKPDIPNFALTQADYETTIGNGSGGAVYPTGITFACCAGKLRSKIRPGNAYTGCASACPALPLHHNFRWFRQRISAGQRLSRLPCHGVVVDFREPIHGRSPGAVRCHNRTSRRSNCLLAASKRRPTCCRLIEMSTTGFLRVSGSQAMICFPETVFIPERFAIIHAAVIR